MKNHARKIVRAAVPVALAAMAIACSARPAPDFWGPWKPVHRYAEQPVQIALQQQYLFHASPLDGTLKGMLTRWAQDAGMTLSYRHPSDFTVHAAAAAIRTTDVASAVTRLTQAYAAQQVAVSVQGNQILVQAGSADGITAGVGRARAGNGIGAAEASSNP